MKKLISMIMIAAMSVMLAVGCGAKEQTEEPAAEAPAQEEAAPAEEEAPADEETAAEEPAAEAAGPVDINVMALKGPTAMGMVKFMDDVEAGSLTDNNYNFTIAAAVDEVTPSLVTGTADIAAVPANLASVLYNNTDDGIRVLAINTLGVLYMVENGDTVKSVEDLKGKTIYASGKGATPEYALNYVLEQNGIDPAKDVTIEWKSEHTECLTALISEENAIAMLPQPFVTTAQMKNESIKVVLDLTEEWDKTQSEAESPSAMITGVLVARTDFVAENPQAVNAFLDNYKASIEYVNGNAADAAALIEKFDIVPAQVAEKALPACNITFIEGSEMKDKLAGYLSVLLEQNPEAIGGALPEDDFYYSH